MKNELIEHTDGDKFWYQNDELHRLNGPACEFVNGDKYWYIDGKKLTEEDFNKKIKELKPVKPIKLINRFIAILEE